ncbi:MAG: TonB-dependent receptor, partial [Saprospiraceae bacterium]|nr:TonB-dependent receptor [Saprospiraceae bacterium]
KGADERRIRTTINTRFRPFRNKGIALGVNANYMYLEEGLFFLPKDAAERAFVHILDPINRERTSLFNLDVNLDVFDRRENKHQLRMRYLNVVRYRTHNPNLPSALFHGEYQFQRRFSDKSVLTAGMGASHLTSKSNLFNKSDTIFLENDTLINAPRENADIVSSYVQWDKRIGERLNLTMGLRWELFQFQNAVSSNLPVFKGGISYAVSPSGFLRLSYGQGYRVPSLAERFIDDKLADGFSIFPNPDLKTETGWTAELGYKRTFVKNSWEGYLDVSAFWMEFEDMNEFSFDLHRPDSVVAIRPIPFLEDFINYLGFKTVNISRARIAGFELSFLADGSAADFPVRLWGGYTYSYPADLQSDPDQNRIGRFLGDLISGIGQVDSSQASGLLKYRNLHTFRFDGEVDVGSFTFGIASSFHSFMHRVDEIIVNEGPYAAIVESLNGTTVVPYLVEFREKHRQGDWVFDLRLHYHIGKHKVSLIGSNIFNREYAIRPGKMNAPLGLTVRWQYVF